MTLREKMNQQDKIDKMTEWLETKGVEFIKKLFPHWDVDNLTSTDNDTHKENELILDAWIEFKVHDESLYSDNLYDLWHKHGAEWYDTQVNTTEDGNLIFLISQEAKGKMPINGKPVLPSGNKIDELKIQIRKELDTCLASDTPTVCATKSDKKGYEQIEQRIIEYVTGNKMTIGDAIITLEREMNPNMLSD